MKYAVIQTGGKQYRVAEGDVLEVERLASKPQESVLFSDVLLYVSDADVKVGNPFVSGMTVSAQVLEAVRGEKIRVSKFKAKARYRRTTGHRQALSKIQITQIGNEKAHSTTSGQEKKTEKIVAAPKNPKIETVEATASVTKEKAPAKKK